MGNSPDFDADSALMVDLPELVDVPGCGRARAARRRELLDRAEPADGADEVVPWKLLRLPKRDVGLAEPRPPAARPPEPPAPRARPAAPLPEAPTNALPGTEAKILVMQQRAAKRQQLFHPDDARA